MTAITSDVLQGLMVAAMMGATAAGTNVFAPRDWPTDTSEMPILLVQSPSEVKENAAGRSGPPQFTVTTTIRVVGRVTAKAQTGDAGAMAALAATGVLQRQIEVAVINNYALRRAIQQFSSVTVKNGVSAEGEQHIAELVMDFALEFYQGPEDFAPNPSSVLEQFAIYADLVNVFSPTGTFAGTPFAGQAHPSPRTSGPDGRAEGAAVINIPQ
jgi:hypothetical protein